jgi:hypothetical protein
LGPRLTLVPRAYETHNPALGAAELGDLSVVLAFAFYTVLTNT